MSDSLLCAGKKMIYDEACIHMRNLDETSASIKYQTSECYKCSLLPLTTIFSGETSMKILKTTYSNILRFSFHNSSFENSYSFYQHGHYRINITSFGVSNIPEEILPADYTYGPLYGLLSALLVCWILWIVGSCIFTHTTMCNRVLRPSLIVNQVENDLDAVTRSISGNSTPRLNVDFEMSSEVYMQRRIKSLDVFRGITITLMLFVNYGGGKYWMFQHSSWNGLTIADIVFPWFAWIMGASALLSINWHLRNSTPKRKILLKVFCRGTALCVFGVMLNSFNNNNIVTLRFPGVLQRLSLAYLMVAVLETLFITIQIRYQISGRLKKVEECVHGWIQSLIMLSLVAVHLIITLYLEVPGCPKGYLGPGGLHMNSSFENCTGGAAGYIDRTLFTNNHLYDGTYVSSVYFNKLPFDPEGLLGTLTTAFTVFLGVHASRVILCHSTPKGRLSRWFIMAVVTGVTAGLLCGWSKETGFIPLNKNLWSISFALATSSLAFLMESVLFYIIDYRGWWLGSPFHQIGKNSILIYVFSIITKESIPWSWRPIDYTTHAHVLWMNLWSTLLWIMTALFLDMWNVTLRI